MGVDEGCQKDLRFYRRRWQEAQYPAIRRSLKDGEPRKKYSPPHEQHLLTHAYQVEAAFATPAADFIPAVHAPADDKELLQFRQFARDIGFDFDHYLSKASGSHGADPISYHFTPFDLNWGWLINFDHDFIGRDALLKLKDSPPNQLVTLVWNEEDVTDVFASLFRPEPFEYMEMPRSLLGNVVGSTVLREGKTIGCAVSRCYSYWFKEMVSLGIVAKEHAAPGTVVEVKWGSEGSPVKIIRAVSTSEIFSQLENIQLM